MRKITPKDDQMNLAIVFLFILILPLLLWNVESVLPYPVMIEELAKLLIVMMIVKKVKLDVSKWVIAIGLLFGLSEAFLYLININIYGNLSALWARLFLTIPMHVLSVVVIYRIGKFGRIWWLAGLIMAIFIHYGFNIIVR